VAYCDDVEQSLPPLQIARQGCLEAGGRTVFYQTPDGNIPLNPRYQPGHVAIEHVYAQYQIPVDQRFAYPVLFNAGGGHSARFYDTTPDGREGWLTLFLRAGFATYAVDRVNVGRSGSDIDAINAARHGLGPAAAIPAMNRYTHEAAWLAFRWGPQYGQWYPDTQFPREHVDTYYRQMLTTYRDPSEEEKNASAFSALLDEVGPATILTWSSSGILGMLAAARRPALVKGILAVEPSPAAYDHLPDSVLPELAKVPIYIVVGDHDEERVAMWRALQARLAAHGGLVTVDALAENGIHGNTHTLPLEQNNVVIMERMVDWLKANVY
jgi:pimeloyl-ACP methyl ester carboxylesterase